MCNARKRGLMLVRGIETTGQLHPCGQHVLDGCVTYLREADVKTRLAVTRNRMWMTEEKLLGVGELPVVPDFP